jgi:hypothetical protein
MKTPDNTLERAGGIGVNRSVADGYAGAAAELLPRYEAVSSSNLYSSVAHLLPEPGSTVINIGAGTGRDAAWLAAKGSRVLAVEPVGAFRDAAGRCTSLRASSGWTIRFRRSRGCFDAATRSTSSFSGLSGSTSTASSVSGRCRI